MGDKMEMEFYFSSFFRVCVCVCVRSVGGFAFACVRRVWRRWGIRFLFFCVFPYSGEKKLSVSVSHARHPEYTRPTKHKHKYAHTHTQTGDNFLNAQRGGWVRATYYSMVYTSAHQQRRACNENVRDCARSERVKVLRGDRKRPAPTSSHPEWLRPKQLVIVITRRLCAPRVRCVFRNSLRALRHAAQCVFILRTVKMYIMHVFM